MGKLGRQGCCTVHTGITLFGIIRINYVGKLGRHARLLHTGITLFASSGFNMWEDLVHTSITHSSASSGFNMCDNFLPSSLCCHSYSFHMFTFACNSCSYFAPISSFNLQPLKKIVNYIVCHSLLLRVIKKC